MIKKVEKKKRKENNSNYLEVEVEKTYPVSKIYAFSLVEVEPSLPSLSIYSSSLYLECLDEMAECLD